MKRYDIYLKFLCSAALTFVLATGCTDLDVPVKSQLTEFPNNSAAFEAASANIYNSCRGSQQWMVNTVASDEAVFVSFGNDWYDGGQYVQLHLHSWTADNPWFPSLWNVPMSGVTSCNTVLSIINDDDSEAAAQVRAMRAYFYFLLMDNFGSAPLVTRLVSEQPDRAPRSELCNFIESELLAVRDKLPTEVNSATYGKPTRYMADALLAKLYLNWAVYSNDDVTTYEPTDTNPKLNDLVAVCDDIIQSGKYDLSDHFLVKFRPDNGPHIKDFIFAIPYDRNMQQGMVYARYWICRSAQKQFGDLPQSVGGTLRVFPAFYAKFNLEGDERNRIWLKGKQYYWENYEETDRPFLINTSKRGIDQFYEGPDADEKFDWQMEFTPEIILSKAQGAEERLDCGNDEQGRCRGYRSIKFYMDTEVTAANGRNQSNDVPVFRYADVLLMKAEAILRGAMATHGDTPASLINQIRQYVGAVPRVTNPTLEDLLDERAREFTDEAWRRNDLIRFGKFEDDWGFRGQLNPQGLNEKFRRIFPIPRDVMNVNTNWKQNAGY